MSHRGNNIIGGMRREDEKALREYPGKKDGILTFSPRKGGKYRSNNGEMFTQAQVKEVRDRLNTTLFPRNRVRHIKEETRNDVRNIY